MGGVQEALSRISSTAFMLTASQALINSMLGQHEQPAVLSAAMKYQTTHRGRLVVNDAMDVLGGAGICRGPANLMGNTYMGLPIAITVEGANILTRSMITFGQGLNRAHPNLINIVNTIEEGNNQSGFMKEVGGIVSHAFTNIGRSLTRAVTRSRSKADLEKHYESQLQRLSANFALSSDLALVLGGRLKFEEMLSGRFADAFGTLYMGYASLWFYKHHKHVEGIDAVFELTMEQLLEENEIALRGVSHNFPVPGIGFLMRTLCFPTGEAYSGPSDKMRVAGSNAITTPTGVRELLSKGVFMPDDAESQLRLLNECLPLACQADAAVAAAKKAKRQLTAEEKALVDQVAQLADRIVQVDSFEKVGLEKAFDKEYERPALVGTKFAKNAAVKQRVAV